MQPVRVFLKEVRDLLSDSGEQQFVQEIDTALTGDEAALWSFLVSNELWGGAGSIADQALLLRGDARRLLEQLLVDLGHEQIAIEHTNEHTEMWTSIFEKRHAQQI